MSKYNSLGELFLAIANAIRAKTGGTDPIVAEDFPAAVEGISAGGGDLDALIDGSLTEITSSVERVRDSAFNGYYDLTSINLPLATAIGSGAFRGCSNLTSVSIPLVTQIGESAFYYCSNLTSVSIPLITKISNSAFYYCFNLTSVNCPLVTSIDVCAFESCSNLTIANFPLVTSVGSGAFQRCSNLTSVSIPLITKVISNTFYVCSKLTSLDFPLVTSIDGYSFNSCYKLTSVILRSETMCTLSNTTAFGKCYHFDGTVNATYNPDGLKDGYIYVPRALIDSYKAATNWTTFATQFRALEDYTVDGTTTGELDESKVSL